MQQKKSQQDTFISKAWKFINEDRNKIGKIVQSIQHSGLLNQFQTMDNKILVIANISTLIIGGALIYLPKKYSWKLVNLGILISFRVQIIDAMIYDYQMKKTAVSDNNSLVAQQIRNLYRFYYPQQNKNLQILCQQYLKRKQNE